MSSMTFLLGTESHVLSIHSAHSRVPLDLRESLVTLEIDPAPQVVHANLKGSI
jgi:hypothetical protein